MRGRGAIYLLGGAFCLALVGCGDGSGARSGDAGSAAAWRLDGRVLVLPRAGETLRPGDQAAEVASVEQVLASFRWEALPYFGQEPALRSEVILDPDLVGEDDGRPTPALCDHTSQTVVLNRDLWRAYGEAEREVVLFHELGHCELGRRHTRGRRAAGGPGSLMNRNAVADAEAFVRDRAYYVRELFTTKQPPPRVLRGR